MMPARSQIPRTTWRQRRGKSALRSRARSTTHEFYPTPMTESDRWVIRSRGGPRRRRLGGFGGGHVSAVTRRLAHRGRHRGRPTRPARVTRAMKAVARAQRGSGRRPADQQRHHAEDVGGDGQSAATVRQSAVATSTTVATAAAIATAPGRAACGSTPALRPRRGRTAGRAATSCRPTIGATSPPWHMAVDTSRSGGESPSGGRGCRAAVPTPSSMSPPDEHAFDALRTLRLNPPPSTR